MAGVAVIRVSGAGARTAFECLSGRLPAPRRAVLRAIRYPDSEEVIDRGLVLWFPAPESFTGEDCCEFHVHGSPAVIAAMFRALGSLARMRPAEPGEFTLRALRRGRLDLTEVEGLSDLIRARTEAQRRQALSQSEGGLRAAAEGWRGELLQIRALCEAAVDFAEEDGIGEAGAREIEFRLAKLVSEIDASIRKAETGQAVRDGFRIVIAGPPNAGKSSLLNALAGREAAIVSAIPGTTRDAIEVMLDLGGLPVIFSDTAGLRGHTDDEIERIGMSRTRELASRAHLVLWLSEDAKVMPPENLTGGEIVRVLNKCDLPQSQSGLIRNNPDYRISVKTGSGMAELLDGLLKRVKAQMIVDDSAIVANERQRKCLIDMVKNLRSAQESNRSGLELIAEELRAATDAVGRLTGRIDVEEVLGEIFSRFCIGK